MLIGKGILPNVYISNISVFESKIEFDVIVADSIKSPRWSHKDIMKNNLNLIVSCITEEHSETSLEVILNKNKPYATSDVVSYLPSKEIIEINHKFEGHKVFKKTISKNIDPDTKSFIIYANLTLDQLNIKGKASSERVLLNGQTPHFTTAFYIGAEQYFGPVHLHNNVYMEGPSHTSGPHHSLTTQVVTNYKIKDLRGVKNIPKGFKKHKVIGSQYSDLHVSFDDEANYNFMFFMNLRNILLNKTKYGSFLATANKKIFNTLLNKFRFNVITVYRDKIKSYNRTTEAATIKKGNDRTLSTNIVLKGYQTEGSQVIAEIGSNPRTINHSFGEEVLALKFNDQINDKTFGDYQYRLELILKDPTIPIIESIKNEMIDMLQEITAYRDLLNSRVGYDYFLNRPALLFESNAKKDEPIYIRAPKKMMEYKSILFAIDPHDERRQLVHSYNLINPKSCTLKSVERFIDDFKLVTSQFQKLFGITFNMIRGNYSERASPRKAADLNLITIKHRFQEVVTPSDSMARISYTNGLVQTDNISKTVLKYPFSLTRGNLSTRFFGEKPASESIYKRILNENALEKAGKKNFSINIERHKEPQVEEERYEKAADYLGKASKFNTFTSPEKNKKLKFKTKVEEEIELKILTKVDKGKNLESIIPNMGNNTQVLVGFGTQADGSLMLKKPIWAKYNNQLLSGETILMQKPFGEVPDEINFLISNKYTIVGNKNNSLKNIEQETDYLNNLHISDSSINEMLFTNNIITDGPDTVATATNYKYSSTPQQPTQAVSQQSPQPSATTYEAPTSSTPTTSTEPYTESSVPKMGNYY